MSRNLGAGLLVAFVAGAIAVGAAFATPGDRVWTSRFTGPPGKDEFVTQSPMPFVDVLASSSPSMPNPPIGAMTGAVPWTVPASVNTVLAEIPESNPVAVNCSVVPKSSSLKTNQSVSKFPLVSATTVHGS